MLRKRFRVRATRRHGHTPRSEGDDDARAVPDCAVRNPEKLTRVMRVAPVSR